MSRDGSVSVPSENTTTPALDLPIWQALLEASPASIVLVDLESPGEPLCYVNAAFEATTGYSKAEVIGRNCRFLQGPDAGTLNIDGRRKMNDAVRSGRSCSVIVQNFRKSGEPFWNEVHIAPLRPAQGEIRYFVGVQHDVSSREAARLELARSNEALETFSSVVAHDLLTPVCTQRDNLELIRDLFVADKDQDALSLIDGCLRSVDRMTALVTGLLSYARSGAPAVEFRPVNLTEVVREAVEDLGALIEQAEATVHIGALPVVSGDRSSLRQLFQNLIQNALKYRGPRPCLVEVAEAKHEQTTCIEVRDNGLGIPAGKCKAIFEAYRRLDSRQGRHSAGLGLATCKRIVENHGGQIWVEPADGDGSIFRLTFETDNSPVPAIYDPMESGKGPVGGEASLSAAPGSVVPQ